MIPRTIKSSILNNIKSKYVLLTGPKRVGKTVLAKNLFSDFQILDYTNDEDKLPIKRRAWKPDISFLILDEIIKLDGWQKLLAENYEEKRFSLPLIALGGNQVDTTTLNQDIPGRIIQFRLHPFDLKELLQMASRMDRGKILTRLEICSGFPEPFLKGSPEYAREWTQKTIDTLFGAELYGLVNIKDIHKIRLLVEVLRAKVGIPISFSALSREIGTSYKTVQRWIKVLEKLYLIFKVTPYHEGIHRSLKKEPKYYFYNTGMVKSGKAKRFENLVALALLKRLHAYEDMEGHTVRLHYLQTKDNKKVDFFARINNHVTLIDTNLDEQVPLKGIRNFTFKKFHFQKVQVVRNLTEEHTTKENILVVSAVKWLGEMNLICPQVEIKQSTSTNINQTSLLTSKNNTTKTVSY